MILAIAILLSAALDAGTMLLLPAGSERNPIASVFPYLAVGLKLTVALALATLVVQRRRYFRGVGMVGVGAWLFGLAANLAVLS